MSHFRYLLALGVVLVPSAPLIAQETTASGNLQMETNWTALKTLVDGANNKAQTAQVLAEAIKACGVKGMFYSPGVSGADAQGCKAPASQVGFTKFTSYGSGAYSSNKVVTSGWHTLCVFSFNHNDSNFWLSKTSGPNAEGKSIWRAERSWGGAEPRIICMD